MNRIASLTLIGLSALAMAAETLTPSAVLKSADKFDKKLISVSGIAKKFNARTSKAGNEYFTFDLTSGSDKISIFGHGKLDKPLADGTKVEVKGYFTKVKTVGKLTFKNELDCSGKKGEKPNLKVLK